LQGCLEGGSFEGPLNCSISLRNARISCKISSIGIFGGEGGKGREF